MAKTICARSISSIPALPKSASSTKHTFVRSSEFNKFYDEINGLNQKRVNVNQVCKNTSRLSDVALFSILRGEIHAVSRFDQTKLSALEMLELIGDDVLLRNHKMMQMCIQSLVQVAMLEYFFKSGRILSKKQLFFSATIDEYLAGMMLFLGDLPQYAMGRAIAQDLNSVILCRDLTFAVNGELMQFDFRNGQLRRIYDRVKYVLRDLEEMLYALSITDTSEESTTKEVSSLENDITFEKFVIDKEEMTILRQKMQIYDELREKVIKRTRDIIKASKNAIYNCHRCNFENADKLLLEADIMINELLPIIEENPTLMFGSFEAALEELAEGKLFRHFISSGKVLPKENLPAVLTPHTYLGALSDFTGEVGRWAVAKATKRDVSAVHLCHNVMDALHGEFLSVGVKGKKFDNLKMNLKKIKKILYDLNLSIRSKVDRNNIEGYKTSQL